jgi:hypothetical protein
MISFLLFPTKILYAFLIFPMCATCPPQLNILSLNTVFGEEYKTGGGGGTKKNKLLKRREKQMNFGTFLREQRHRTSLTTTQQAGRRHGRSSWNTQYPLTATAKEGGETLPQPTNLPYAQIRRQPGLWIRTARCMPLTPQTERNLRGYDLHLASTRPLYINTSRTHIRP